MWTLELQANPAGTSCWAKITSSTGRISFDEALKAWQHDASFQTFWTDCLRDIPLAGYCWECPPLTRSTLAQPFECVFVSSPALVGTTADSAPFSEHFESASGSAAVSFESLGRDAMLIAPCPLHETCDYAHLATFCRTAPATQAAALWQATAAALEQRLGSKPVWLSTAGLGVDWLHVRLDSRPKYYRHRDYARTDYWDRGSQ